MASLKALSAPTAVVFDLFGVVAYAQSPTGRAVILAAAGAPPAVPTIGGEVARPLLTLI